jgi:hypothetical protein
VVVEVRVHHRAIVLAAGDERDGSSAVEKIVRVLGVQAYRLRRGRVENGGEQRDGPSGDGHG